MGYGPCAIWVLCIGSSGFLARAEWGRRSTRATCATGATDNEVPPVHLPLPPLPQSPAWESASARWYFERGFRALPVPSRKYRSFADEVSQKLDANADASFERPLERQNGVSNESLSSHYKGVGWDKSKNKWKVSITKDGKRSHLGYFTDEKEAARRYAEAIPPLGRPLDFPEEPIDSWKFSSSACQGGHIGQQDDN